MLAFKELLGETKSEIQFKMMTNKTLNGNYVAASGCQIDFCNVFFGEICIYVDDVWDRSDLKKRNLEGAGLAVRILKSDGLLVELRMFHFSTCGNCVDMQLQVLPCNIFRVCVGALNFNLSICALRIATFWIQT